jgi:opacity protein-like surface antigen
MLRKLSDKHWILGALPLGLMAGVVVLAPTGAFAASCSANTTGRAGPLGPLIPGVAGGLTAAVTNSNLAFLSQSTAFVAGGSGAAPGEMGGGVWSRAVGGEINLDTSSSTRAISSVLPGGPTKPKVSQDFEIDCSSEVHSDFVGLQVGADIAKFNLGGWNVHFGATAGVLQSNQNVVGGLPDPLQGPDQSTVQAPFLGAYFTASKDGFYVDGLVRGDFYSAQFNSPTLNLTNQTVDAQGFSISGSTGYQYTIPNTKWFIEPSAGLIYSQVSVDPMNLAGPPASKIKGTLSVNDITDTIGRIGLRVGTSVTIGDLTLQPFAAASVWRDFGDPYSASYTTCPGVSGPISGCAFLGDNSPSKATGAYTGSNFGTFGQYSVGVSGQLGNTGWLGFARADYRDGPSINGWDLTGGVRYQFDDAAPRPDLPTRKSPPVVSGVNWTGFYIGGFAGADAGWSRMEFSNTTATPTPRGVLAGGVAGYNYQIGQLVVGAEGDLGGADLKGSTGCGPLVADTKTPLNPTGHNLALFNMNCNSNSNWMGTLTARAGYVWERALLYGKLGAALSDQTYSTSCNNDPINSSTRRGEQCANLAGALSSGFSTSAIRRLGWTTGVGFEYALFGNWSTKAEFDYANFGSQNVVGSDGTNFKASASVETLKIGLNYRFGG